MTTQDHFNNYLSDHLNLTEEDIKKIQIHIELRDNILKKLELKDDTDNQTGSFLTGSYVRSTAIRPPKDVDFFIVLNDKKYGDLKPNVLLDLLDATLKDILPDKTIFQQTHSITIEYDEEFSIDVIPAFKINDSLYKIPHVSKDGISWLESNPKIHQEILTKANKSSGGILIPIIKLLKSWKRDKCDYVKSFHLELLVMQILVGEKVGNYAEGLKIFFGNAKSYLSSPCIYDPANTKNPVDNYLENDERMELLKLIESESSIAQNACKLEGSDNTESAIKEWDKIFIFDKGRKKYAFVNPSHEKDLKIPEDLKYKINITAKIYNNSVKKYKENYYSGSRKLSKGLKLRFYIDASHIPDPKNIIWQVVNNGKDAETARQKRGELLSDEGNMQRDEYTQYRGTHYINCFVVKNNIRVAKDRLFVKIQ